MDIYQQPGHDPSAPTSSAIAAVSHGAARLAISIVRSAPYLPADVAANLLRALSLENLQTLAIVLVCWVIATLIGGVVGLAINGLLIVYGLYELYGQVGETWQVLRKWASTAYAASDDKQLDEAAHLFAEAVSQGAVLILEVVVTHRIFTKIKGPLSRRFPPSEALRAEYEKAVSETKRRITEAGEEPRRTDRPSDKASEEPRRTGQPSEKTSEPVRERVARAGERVADLGRGEGIRRAGEFPTGVVVVGGLALGAACITAIAAVGSSRGK